jgi:hypothetical protein
MTPLNADLPLRRVVFGGRLTFSSTMTRTLLVAAVALIALVEPSITQPIDRAVVLVTLDGARVEEVFGGLDLAILRSTLPKGQTVEQQDVYRRFWAETPEERRRKLMPFFWGVLMRDHGSIAGNPAHGSRVHLTNGHWFSYPGYSEMLVGRADDAVIKSNEPIRNPRPTVLEHLRERAGLTRQQVAVFASWSVFSAIAEHDEGRLTINAGYQPYSSPTDDMTRLSALQFATPTPWDTVRHDVYTVAFAMDHLSRHRPRVLYLALGETDDWAHDGRYDRVLESYRRSDGHLEQLWQWLQSQPDYRDRTSILLTTDHGRGRTPADWRDHGKDVAGASETWMAFVSPLMQRRGEWRTGPPITSSQVAATLVAMMGLDPKEFVGAAPPVAAVLTP